MNKRGFTFIELLIAVSIFAVAAIALYSTFFAGISVWRRSGKSGDIYQDIRFVVEDMTKDFKNTIYYTKEKESIFRFSGTAEEVAFVTLEGLFLEKDVSRKELVKVAYRFDDGRGELIMARADKSIGFDIKKAKEEILLKDVEDFKFEYCYDSGDEDKPYLWKEEWKDENLRIPRGIRVSFRIKAEKEKEPLKFTKTIFIPIGVLGEKEVGL